MRAAALVGLPLVGVSWLGGHELAYSVLPSAAGTAGAHGYLAGAPFALILLAAVALVALALRAAGRAGPGVRPGALAAVPLLGFALQELVEGAVLGSAPWTVAAAPVVLLGLALQLPLALAALLVARALTGLADAMARPAPSVAPATPPRPRPAPESVLLRAAPALAGNCAGRAPPSRP